MCRNDCFENFFSGRLCGAPLRLDRNSFSHPPVDADVPADVTSEFDSGKPWHSADFVPQSSMFLADVQRFVRFSRISQPILNGKYSGAILAG